MSQEPTPPDPQPDPTPADPPPAGADYSIPGMRIQAGGPGDPWALVVRTAAPQEKWVVEPQSAADRNSLMVTPTTILYQGRPYRIHEEEPSEAGWIYRLQPCPDGEIQHQVIELEREKVIQAAAELKDFRKVQTLSHLSAGYEILLGWLPARWQEELSHRWHFSPADATRKNGMFSFLFGLGAAFPSMILIHPYMGFFMLLMAIDGATRWAWGFAGEQPLGFIPLEIAERLVHGVVGLVKKVR